MTHSSHRQGTYDDLCDDFVVLGRGGQPDLPERLKRFMAVGGRYHPINVPGIRCSKHLVYDHKDNVRALLSDLAKLDLGLSITVSGLRDVVEQCCIAVGLTPHTISQSLGFWGNTRRLANSEVLKITTMCGHERVSPSLVADLVGKVRRKATSSGDAARRMGGLCACNIFNEVRARKLVEELAIRERPSTSPDKPAPVFHQDPEKKVYGIFVDQESCAGCVECLPYCSMEAFVENSDGKVSIDPARCTECGLCWQASICPLGAIEAGELRWPRTLRGKFQHIHAAYRMAGTMATSCQPTFFTGEGRQFGGAEQLFTEQRNDVTGFFRPGEFGVFLELGRPHLGATLRDVQKITGGLATLGLLVDVGPLADLVVDQWRGRLREDVLDEKVGRVWIRVKVRESESAVVLQRLREVAGEIDTVFAVNVISRVSPTGSTIADRIASEIGVTPSPHCKTNVGLGRPLAG